MKGDYGIFRGVQKVNLVPTVSLSLPEVAPLVPDVVPLLRVGFALLGADVVISRFLGP